MFSLKVYLAVVLTLLMDLVQPEVADVRSSGKNQVAELIKTIFILEHYNLGMCYVSVGL